MTTIETILGNLERDHAEACELSYAIAADVDLITDLLVGPELAHDQLRSCDRYLRARRADLVKAEARRTRSLEQLREWERRLEERVR